MKGDIASELVAGVDRFLLGELRQSVERRGQYWHRDFSSHGAYQKSIVLNRQRLAHILGLRDERVRDTELRLLSTVSQTARVGRGDSYEVFAISWPAFGDVTGQGLLLSPRDIEPVATVIAIPDCSLLPEQVAGLLSGIERQS